MNVFAIWDPSAASSAGVARALQASACFDWVGYPPGSRWLVGHRGSPAGRVHSTFFVEAPPPLLKSALASKILPPQSEPSFLQAVSSLPGDFTFLSFDEDDTVCAVRAAAATAPLYLWKRGERLAVASRLGDLARFLPDEPELDPWIMAVFASGFPWFVDGRTLLRGVRAIDPGHLARGTPRRGWQVERWWNASLRMPQRPSEADRHEHARHLRAALVHNIDTAISNEGSSLVTFSGGVDSSCIVSIAGGELQRAFSTLSFVADAEPTRSDTRRYIDPLLQLYSARVRRHWEYVDSPANRLAWLRGAPSELFVVAHPALCVLPSIAKEVSVSSLCGGEFCDDLFGSTLTLNDWGRGTSLVETLVGSGRRVCGERAAVRWAKLFLRERLRRPVLPFAAELPSFIRSSLRSEYAARIRSEQAAVARDARGRIHIAKRLESVQPAIAMNWEVTSSLGIRRYYPFYTRELVELALGCHPSEGIGPGTKQLVRSALRGLVPDSHLGRTGKERRGAAVSTMLPWDERLPAELEGVVDPNWPGIAAKSLPAADALRMMSLLNIVRALRNLASERRGARARWGP